MKARCFVNAFQKTANNTPALSMTLISIVNILKFGCRQKCEKTRDLPFYRSKIGFAPIFLFFRRRESSENITEKMLNISKISGVALSLLTLKRRYDTLKSLIKARAARGEAPVGFLHTEMVLE